MRKLSVILLLFLFAANCNGPEYDTFEYTADAELDQALVSVNVPLADATGGICLQANDELIPAQVERITDSRAYVWWFANQQAGETVEYTTRQDAECADTGYAWEQVGDHSNRLVHNGQPLLQYEHPVFDPDNVEETKKAFHHVFSPVSDEIITKGPGGLFSHHRGIFFGYNQVSIGDRVLDFWHANDGEYLAHTRYLDEFEGPVFGGHIAQINWTAPDDEVWLEERRDIRSWLHSDNSYIVDLSIEMYAIAGLIRLDGDLQHAGVQFRAAQYVADNRENTRFIRPADWADYPQDYELAEGERENMPWNAMQFEIEDNTYTVVYMSHPDNPGRTKEMSERLYGRFGEFFSYQQSEGAPVFINYRFWIIDGEAPSVDEIEAMYQKYAG